MVASMESRLELAAVLALEGKVAAPLQIANDVKKLLSIASKVQRITESECNGIERYDHQLKRSVPQWTDNDQAHADKQLESARAKASEIAKTYGAEVVRCGGDPRGFTLALKLKSGRTNSFANDHWGIPT